MLLTFRKYRVEENNILIKINKKLHSYMKIRNRYKKFIALYLLFNLSRGKITFKAKCKKL